ncbi:MAG: cache domain-containing protein [Rickettsiales bacterium]|nr:cache domain-containing protein [Rickettsiales bacterium]
MIKSNKEKIILVLSSILVLLAISYWQYTKHRDQIVTLLETQSHTVSTILDSDFTYIEAQMEYLTNQIIKDPDDSQYIYTLLSAYDTKHKVNNIVSWNMFTWVDSDWNIIVDGEKGIFDTPTKIYRPYLDMTKIEPSVMHVGLPRYGAVSNRWLIPAGMGVNDADGNYNGAVIFGFDISDLNHKIQTFVDNSKIEFYLVDRRNDHVIIPNKHKKDQQKFVITDYIPNYYQSSKDVSLNSLFTEPPVHQVPLEKSSYNLVLRYNPDLLYANNISAILNISGYSLLVIFMYFLLNYYKNRYFERFIGHITTSVNSALEENKLVKINESTQSGILINSLLKKYLSLKNKLKELNLTHSEEVRKNQSARLQNVNQFKTNKIVKDIREKEYKLFTNALESMDRDIIAMQRGDNIDEHLDNIVKKMKLMRFSASDPECFKTINITKLIDELGSIVFPELIPDRKKFIVYGVTHTNKKFHSSELLVTKILVGLFNSIRECYQKDARIVVRTELEDHFLHVNISFEAEKSIQDIFISENHVQSISELLHSDINHAKHIIKTLHGKLNITENKGKCNINLVLVNESAAINYNNARSILQYLPQKVQ